MLQENSVPRKGYLIGGGIASLSAAVFMIRDGRMQGEDIYIFEESSQLGGALDVVGNEKEGYMTYFGRIFDYEQYPALFNLLSEIPSVTSPSVTVREDIHSFNDQVITNAKARLIDKNGSIVDTSSMGFNDSDRMELVRLLAEPEAFLNSTRIDEIFSEHFFNSNFWYMWATSFSFQPWHSAMELRRYIKLFMHEVTRMDTQTGLKQSPYNQFESVILPMINWLKFKGVNFKTQCKVTNLDFLQELAEEQIVSAVHYENNGKSYVFDVNVMDMVIVSNGCTTGNASLGSMNQAPAQPTNKKENAWSFWKTIAEKRPEFGNPEPFCNNTSFSQWESFTVTCHKGNKLLQMIEQFTGNKPGTGGLITFRDSSWLLSISIPHQPYFIGQSEDVSVFWGYALHVDKTGDYVNKKMNECSGAEILTELLCHLHMESYTTEMLATSICIPYLMPYVSSSFMPRHIHDRPKVRPKGYFNLAFASQFTEIPDGAVFTVEYSVRCAMEAVYSLMRLDKNKIPPYYEADTSLAILFKSIRSMNK